MNYKEGEKLESPKIVNIEYGDYQEGNSISFDNEILKKWLEKINEIFSNANICGMTDCFSLMSVLLYEGEVMPFIRRNNNIRFVGYTFKDSGFPRYDAIPIPNYISLNLKSESNKIYWNNIDVTNIIKERYREFYALCIELNNDKKLEKIWYYWNGGKLTNKLIQLL